jgi:hypothetical protein
MVPLPNATFLERLRIDRRFKFSMQSIVGHEIGASRPADAAAPYLQSAVHPDILD